MEKSKAERLIERMYFLEHGKLLSCSDILYIAYIEKENSITDIAKHYVQSYGTIQKLLKKFEIHKDFILI